MSGKKGRSGRPIADRTWDYLALAEAGLNHEEIAENLQVRRQSVSRALAGLAEHGYLVPESRRGAGSHRRNK